MGQTKEERNATNFDGWVDGRMIQERETKPNTPHTICMFQTGESVTFPSASYCLREAKSNFVSSGPARSRSFAAGIASWGSDGRGAWCLPVNSRARFGVSLGEFGILPVTGVMPMGIVLPARLSRVRWLLEVIFTLVVVLLLLDGVMPASLIISSMYPWPWRKPLFFLSDVEATMGVVNQPKRGSEVVRLDVFIWLWLVMSLVLGRAGCSDLIFDAVMVAGVKRGGGSRLILADRARAHQLWTSLTHGAGACSSGRRPAIAGEPSLLLAEGRPSSFLPAMMPPGRQFSCWLMATARYRGSLVAPTGLVPGDGEVVLDRRLRTRSLFIFQPRILLAKVQGLVSILQFLQGPICNMRCLLSS